MASQNFTKSKGNVYATIIKECLEPSDSGDNLMINIIAEYIRSISEDEQIKSDIRDKLHQLIDNTIKQTISNVEEVKTVSTGKYDEEFRRLKPADTSQIGLRIPQNQYDLINPTRAAVVELTLQKIFFNEVEPRKICCSINIWDT